MPDWLEHTLYLFEHSPDAMLLLDPGSPSGNWCIVACNTAATRMYGYSRHELDGQFLVLIDVDTSTQIELQGHLSPLKGGGGIRFECLHRRKDGSIILADCAVSGVMINGRILALLIARDITERNRTERHLRYEALHDALTGLPNRIVFYDRLVHVLDRARRHRDVTYAVLLLDIDDFKVVNDRLGHLAGDQLLIGTAHRFTGILRPADTIARLSGDEFAILIEDFVSQAWILNLTARIQAALAEPHPMNNTSVIITASIGVAVSHPGYRKPEDILGDADIALYRAKALGKGRSVVFEYDLSTPR